MPVNDFTKNNAERTRSYNPNRFNALDSGIVYIIVLVVFFGVSYFAGKLFGEPLRELYKFDVYAYMVVNILISQLSIFIVALIYSLIRKTNPFRGGGYIAKIDGVQMLMAILLIMGIMMSFYHAHLQFGSDAEKILGEGFVPDNNLSPYSGFFVLVYIVLTVLCPAMFEEMLFRGIIMRGLEQFGVIASVVLSSLAFALMHGNFSQLILQFIGGLAIGSVVTITGNYLIGSVMHGFNNLFSVVYGILITNLGKNFVSLYLSTVTEAATILIGVAFLTISIIYFGKLAFEKKRKEILGVLPVGRFDKVEYYEKEENGEHALVPHYVKPEQKSFGESDERLFKIGSKYRKLNKKSPFMLSCIIYGAAILIAIISIFI